MNSVYQLEKHTNAPGHNSKKTLKTFTTLGAAEHWLRMNGYKEMSERWENPEDNDPKDMFDVWVYVKIKRYEVE